MSISSTSELESSLMSFAVACMHVLHLGDIVKSRRARGNAARSRLSCSLTRSRAARFARPNRRACSQASFAASDSTSATFVIQVVNLLLTWQGEDKKKEREDGERGWGRLFEGGYYSRKYVKSPIRLVIHWYVFLVKDFFIVFSFLSKS